MSNLVADAFLAEKAAAIRTLALSAARNLAEIGKHLNEVKERFGRGDNPQFLAWALDMLGWSQATVYRYLRIFEFSQTGDFINVDKIDLDVSSLYLLAAPSTTDEARAEVIEQATKTTKKITRAAVKKTVARHAKAKAKKAAPADAVVLGTVPPVAEEAEPRYMLVSPDAAPPIVHVDPPAPAGGFMVEHLREELAARDEEIDDLKSAVSGFVTLIEEKDREIVELRAARAGLEDRVRRRDDEIATFLFDHIVSDDVGILELLNNAHLAEVAEAFRRIQAARQQPAPEEEPAPPTQPVETGAPLTWDNFTEAYFMADDCPASPNNHPKINAGFVLWADKHGFDIEQLAGAPEEVTYLWLLAAENCRTQYAPRNTFKESSTAILKRYGSGRRVSVATIATDLKWNRKHIADILDKMSALDLDGLLVREKEGRETFWTIRREAKEVTQ
jgi:hypothetical protein